jgi:hypothetical protein
MEKTYKVYEIINSMGTVAHVGETCRTLKRRFYEHNKRKPEGGNGKFYQRQDLSIHEVARFDNRPEARALEGQLKLEYGLECGERISGGKITQTIIRTCHNCNRTFKGSGYFMHIKACKQRI